MKRIILLPLLLLVISLTGFSKTWTIANLGSAYTPGTITINLGDTVIFNISSNHDVVEVSKATWDANEKTALPGFTLPFGGGTLLPAQLSAGTHYYVCTPHAVWGMKGTIIVQGPTGITEIKQKATATVYPNPSNGVFQVAVNGLSANNNSKLEVFSLLGEKVYETSISNSVAHIDLSNSSKGVYLMQINDGEGYITKKIIKQ